jgi:hypothetical protein
MTQSQIAAKIVSRFYDKTMDTAIETGIIDYWNNDWLMSLEPR